MISFRNAALLAVLLIALIGLYVLVERPFESQRKKEPPAFVPDFEKKRA